jgi:hypothetical protein
MRRALGSFIASLAIVAASLPVAGVTAADPAAQLRPINLRVFGGAGWHADNYFRLDWDPPVAGQDFPVSAVDYRVRDTAGGIVVPESRVPWNTTVIESIPVPAKPGAYTADVWLEGPGGERGPQVSAMLLFDNVRPAPARPLPPLGWVRGDSAARLSIEHPAGPQPISGIRGYAVSVDRGSESAPCAGTDRCDMTETDLHDGVDGDTISLAPLSEGRNVVRAVAVSGSGMRSAEVRSAIVRVDATLPAVALGGAPPGWVRGPVRLTATATDALSGMASTAACRGSMPAIRPRPR